ncbi:MAG: LysM peptidoglycan-binding domain-containing protein [bacterium]
MLDNLRNIIADAKLSGKKAAFISGLVLGSVLTLIVTYSGNLVDSYLHRPREEVQRDVMLPGLDLPENDRVQASIQHYLQAGRKADLVQSYRRSGSYLPMITAIFEEHDVPQALAYLPMIESRFIPTRRSPAGAVGLWQIMPATASQYGLKYNRWIDERRDPEKATVVAAQHLGFLYKKLRNWDLVLAAYNCGLSKLRRAMRSEGSADFWQLERIPRETYEFVPGYYAILHILQDPQQYGIVLPETSDPLDYESIDIEATFSIEQLANLTSVPPSVLKRYNPALTSNIAPSGSYSVKVPKGVREQFLENSKQNGLERVEITYTTHKVRRGETLAKIAKKYGTTVSAIMADNSLRSARRIKAGSKLRIASVTINKPEAARKTPDDIALQDDVAESSKVRFVYKVERDGLSLGSLTRTYLVTREELMAWNPWLRTDHLQAGEELSIYKSVADIAFHKTRRGDSLWKLARRYKTTVRELKRWNQLTGSKIYPGSNLIVSLN